MSDDKMQQWANRNVWNDPALSKEDRVYKEIESLKRLKKDASLEQQQEQAWLKDEYYDLDHDKE